MLYEWTAWQKFADLVDYIVFFTPSYYFMDSEARQHIRETFSFKRNFDLVWFNVLYISANSQKVQNVARYIKQPKESAVFPLVSYRSVKGSLTRDFRSQFFFHESVSSRPPSIPVGPFWIFSKIRGDVRELMFITGVNDTGEKLFSGVNDTGD